VNAPDSAYPKVCGTILTFSPLARLRFPVRDWWAFQRCYSDLPLALQAQFAHRVVDAIESRDEWDLEEFGLEEPGLLTIPAVARAALAKGWTPSSDDFCEVIRASEWTKDPAFTLSLARRLRSSAGRGDTFWTCCSDGLRRDKAFWLEVLKLDDPPPLHVEGELKDDYDILCATFAHRDHPPGRRPTRRERDFLRTVRDRLQQYLSLEAFMGGISRSSSDEDGGSRRRSPQQDRPSASPLSLLRQDRDAVADFKTRMVELLGCVSHEEASVLRRVSLTFTMHGF
jgi:hypothetical protein